MRVGLVGGVNSSLLTLQKLIEYGFCIVGVWGYEPVSSLNISSYCCMRELSEKNHLSYYPFVKVNTSETKVQIKEAHLDILFVVGLSQLIDTEIIKMPRFGCVGFHPTLLPQGRGRAPLAWLVMNEKEGAATFFKINETVDAGDIYVQEPFAVTTEDDACSVANKVRQCMMTALDRWLPFLLEGIIMKVPQDGMKATYYAKRAPLDGCINWYETGEYIDRIVKASTNPHPGAFSFYGNFKIVIWKSSYCPNGFAKGVIGRVVAMVDSKPVIQTGCGFVELKEYQIMDYTDRIVDKNLVIGSRLGYYDQYEIFKLKNEIELVKKRLSNEK